MRWFSGRTVPASTSVPAAPQQHGHFGCHLPAGFGGTAYTSASNRGELGCERVALLNAAPLNKYLVYKQYVASPSVIRSRNKIAAACIQELGIKVSRETCNNYLWF